jgi:hypothetical protein
MYTNKHCDLNSLSSIGRDPRGKCFYDPHSSENHGCGITAPQGSFGDEFNRHKGGIFALLIEEGAIKFWFFPRDKVPVDLGHDKPDPQCWGAPIMDLRPGNCNIGDAFKKMHVVSTPLTLQLV